MFYWKRPEYPEKNADLLESNNRSYHMNVHRIHLTMAGNEITTGIVTVTICIDRYKSSYPTISFIGGGNRSTRRKPPTWR